MSSEHSISDQCLLSLVKKGDLDRLQDHFDQHPEADDRVALSEALYLALRLHTDTNDFESILNFLLL